MDRMGEILKIIESLDVQSAKDQHTGEICVTIKVSPFTYTPVLESIGGAIAVAAGMTAPEAKLTGRELAVAARNAFEDDAMGVSLFEPVHQLNFESWTSWTSFLNAPPEPPRPEPAAAFTLQRLQKII